MPSFYLTFSDQFPNGQVLDRAQFLKQSGVITYLEIGDAIEAMRWKYALNEVNTSDYNIDTL